MGTEVIVSEAGVVSGTPWYRKGLGGVGHGGVLANPHQDTCFQAPLFLWARPHVFPMTVKSLAPAQAHPGETLSWEAELPFKGKPLGYFLRFGLASGGGQVAEGLEVWEPKLVYFWPWGLDLGIM